MFNENQKQRYIEHKNQITIMPKNYLYRLFEKTEIMENNFRKDCFDWTKIEIIEFYKFLSVPSYESLIYMNSVLNGYTSWAIGNALVKDGQNHYLEIDQTIIGNCVNKSLQNSKIYTKSEVYEMCSQLPNYSDKVLLLGVFEGIKGKNYSELVNLSVSDISDNNILLRNTEENTERTIIISNQLKNYMYESSEEYIYVALSGVEGRSIKLKEIPNLVIKPLVNARDDSSPFQKGRRLYTRFIRILNYLGLNNGSIQGIYESGRINYIKEKAKQNNISPEEYLRKLYNGNSSYGNILWLNGYVEKYGEILNK